MLGERARSQIFVPHRTIAGKQRHLRRREHHDVPGTLLRERHYCSTIEA